MMRDDLSFLLEKAAALVLLVIGLDWLPQLIDVWIGGVGPEDPAPRYVALRTFVPLAAGAFLLMRRKPASSPPPLPASMPPTPTAAAIGRADWLWIGCKIVGAVAMLYGVSNLILSVAWLCGGLDVYPARAVAVGHIASQAVYAAGGAWLLFGERIWRFACREVPATR